MNPTKTFTKKQTKYEFRLYFSDLNAALKSDGGKADRQTEWQNYLRQNVEEGHLPVKALEWKL